METAEEEVPAAPATPEEEASKIIQTQQAAETKITEELASKGLDFKGLQSEYDTNGSLTPETMTKLNDAGYPKEAVEMFIAGLEAQAGQFVNAVFKAVGGEEAYAKVSTYVKGLGQADIQAFDSIVETGNVTAIKAVVEGYKAQMSAKYGTANPTILGGGANVGAATSGFASKADMVAAISDPKYGRDAAYTHQVEKRIGDSKFF